MKAKKSETNSGLLASKNTYSKRRSTSNFKLSKSSKSRLTKNFDNQNENSYV